MPLRVSGVPPDLEMTTASVCTELTVECVECAVEAVRVGVVEEEELDLVGLRAAERVCDKLRAECRTADADHE